MTTNQTEQDPQPPDQVMRTKPKPKKVRKPSTPEQRAKRREAHWRRTGVGDRTINWMKDHNML